MNNVDWLYYLSENNQRNQLFFKMVDFLKDHNLLLVPIKLEQALSLSNSSDLKPLVLVTDSFLERDIFFKKYQRIMKSLLVRKKFEIFHFSSSSECEILNLRNSNHYHFLRLPARLDEFFLSQIIRTREENSNYLKNFQVSKKITL